MAAGTAYAHTITVSHSTQAATAGLVGSVSDGLGRAVSTLYDDSGDQLTNTYTAGGQQVSSSCGRR